VTGGQPAYRPDRSADAGHPNASNQTVMVAGADAFGAGVNRFRVIERIKHSSVIVLRLDSVTRAG